MMCGEVQSEGAFDEGNARVSCSESSTSTKRRLCRAPFGRPGQPSRYPSTIILLFSLCLLSYHWLVNIRKIFFSSVFGYFCIGDILPFSTWLLFVLGAMRYCYVCTAGVCSKIGLVTKAMRWFIILRRSAWYLGKLVAKAMWRLDVWRDAVWRYFRWRQCEGKL